MTNALGLVEYLKVPTGMVAADKMAKTSDIKIIHAAVVCPGKYIVLFKGSLSAVKSALEVGVKDFEHNVIDSFLLGNPTEKIYGAIAGNTTVDISGAIGIVESYSVASIIEAADIAAKTSHVELVEVRLARGMCGKSFFIINGGRGMGEGGELRGVKGLMLFVEIDFGVTLEHLEGTSHRSQCVVISR